LPVGEVGEQTSLVVLRVGSAGEVRDSEAAVVRESGGKAETGVGSERGLDQSGIN